MPIVRGSIRYCFLALACLLSSAWGQVAATPAATDSDEDTARMQELVLRVTRSNYDPTVGRQEMPLLQQAFDDAKDPLMKEKLASVIVALGNKDDVYWSILARAAQQAVDSRVPNSAVYDANGKSIPGEISPRFATWAKSKGLTISQAFEEADKFFSAILLVAQTGDLRGQPVLRQALSSPNHLVQAFAAKGLAVLQDKDYIPHIIDAARHAPTEARQLIAAPLVAFNDPQAQAAANELIPDKSVLDGLAQKVKDKGPRGVW